MQSPPRLADLLTTARHMNMRKAGLPLLTLTLSLTLTACAGHRTVDTSNNVNMSAPTGTVGPKTLNVADAAIAGGDPTMALNVSQSVLATDPDNVDALVHEGEAYYALDRCPPAEAAFESALKYDPKSADAQNGLGRCLLRTDPVKAEAAFLAATTYDPGNAAAYSNLGIARDLQGNYTGAAAAYQQSLANNPGSIATAVNLGLSLALSGQGEAALQYLGPLATGPGATPKIRQDYALALLSAGRAADARNVLAVDLPPDKIDDALAGYQALISQSVTGPTQPAAPAPTQPQVQTAPITQSSTPVPLTPTASAPPPAPVAYNPPPAPVYTPPPAPAYTPPPTPAPMPTPTPAAMSAPAKPAPVKPAPAKPATVTTTASTTTVTKPAAPAPMDTAAVTPAPKPAPTPAPAPAPAPMKTAAVMPVAPPVPAQSAPASAPNSAMPVATASEAPASAVGSHSGVQIAALSSEDAAQAEWQKISGKNPSLFEGKSPDIVKADVNGHDIYRLRVAGFASHADAQQFCDQLTAAGGPCIPANF